MSTKKLREISTVTRPRCGWSNATYWRLRLREFTNRDSNLDTLERLAQSLSLTDEEKDWMPSQAAMSKLSAAVRTFKQVKIDAANLRDSHLSEMATLASVHGMSTSAASAAICAREKASRQFRQLQRVLNTTTACGLERIDVPNVYAVLRLDEQVPRISLVVKEEIEQVLVPHIRKRDFNNIKRRPLEMECVVQHLG